MVDASWIVRAGKIVTVSEMGTIDDGAMVISHGKIMAIDAWEKIRRTFPELRTVDYSDFVITPSLVDCHTHLLEFAATSLYPVTNNAQFLAGKALMLRALTSGITAVGEQICGHPDSEYKVEDYREIVKDLRIDCVFAATSITIGLTELVRFSAVTGRRFLTDDGLKNLDLNEALATHSDYPGENLFINATPANFTKDQVPRAGEIMYKYDELKEIVDEFHRQGKQIGVHVAGEDGIDLTLRAGVDVLHHAHGITEEQIKRAKVQDVKIVATPLGGTHMLPNSPGNIVDLVDAGLDVSIATDAYLPPYPGVPWLSLRDGVLYGSEIFMILAAPALRELVNKGYDENDALKLITLNPAAIMQRDDRYGKLAEQMDANFLVATGVPAIDMTDVKDIKGVYYRGEKVVQRE